MTKEMQNEIRRNREAIDNKVMKMGYDKALTDLNKSTRIDNLNFAVECLERIKSGEISASDLEKELRVESLRLTPLPFLKDERRTSWCDRLKTFVPYYLA